METSYTLERLLEHIKSSDPEERTEAWLNADGVGADAVRPLLSLIGRSGPNVEQLGKELAELEIAGVDNAQRQQVIDKQQELQQQQEVGRAAKRGLWKIARHAARPGAESERLDVVEQLTAALQGSYPVSVRREIVLMLTEMGGEQAVKPIAALLTEKPLRDEARIALERIPTKSSLAALSDALKEAHGDFKESIARSLQARGVEISGIVSQTQTSVDED
jgi:hypothetical protein